MPTASEFSTVLAEGKKGGESVTRRTYMLKLAGERISGVPMESYSNASMERGKTMEAEARDFYSMVRKGELQPVGFIINDAFGCGCSPDRLIGKNGALEIKTALRHIVIDKQLRADFPPEHKAQSQGTLLVAERDWIDIAIYPIIEADMCRAPNIPMFIKRAKRDEPYIKELEAAIRKFNDELNEVVERIKRYRGAP